MRLDEAGLDAYTDRFDSYALRHETLDRYDVASDDDAFTHYLAGRPRPPEFGQAWHGWIADRIAEGRQVRRVRVLYGPPSPYLCFECEWGYTGNVAAGEQVRVLDLTEQPRPAALVDAEFWLLDGCRAAVMAYDPDGVFLHADTVEGVTAQPYVNSAEATWSTAEPFRDWWARHPQWHRSAWLERARA